MVQPWATAIRPHSLRLWSALLVLVGLVGGQQGRVPGHRIFTYEELKDSVDQFTKSGVTYYSELLFDIPRYQLIVGAREYLFRLSLEGLKVLEEAHWPAPQSNITTCFEKGQKPEDCHNFIRVLLSHNSKLFTCGTNAFSPECSWRDINNLNTVLQWESGIAKCPYSPHYNSTALMTVQGSYYIASALDFSAQDYAIYRIMGKAPLLRTVQYDPKWLNEPNFVASYEIGNFTYFFFKETAVEYINCGKIIYSRIGRMCKNDKGGNFMLKDNWTTFLKARLNCSIPGQYPFYYNEIQSVHYLEREQLIYGVFTTPENSIFGSAICIYNMSAVHKAFNSPFKYQNNPKAAWERQSGKHEHFQCQVNDVSQFLLDSEKYQLMDDAVQPIHSQPVYTEQLQRFNHIVVDVVRTKFSGEIQVFFVATVEGLIKKLVVLPNSQNLTTCLVEELHLSPKNRTLPIMSLKLLKDTNSLYIGTNEAVLRIPLHRCKQFTTQSECLNAMDPYCGWNEYQLACTTAPHRNPLSSFWHQQPITCPPTDIPVDGGWSTWSAWFECSQTGAFASGDRCLCRQRYCTDPSPANEGKPCEGTDTQVTNCTTNGQWTEWSAWSSCSQSCGLAVKSRRRACYPIHRYGGRSCIGPEKDEIFCTTNPPCPVQSSTPVNGQWSEWATWEECSVPCGRGIQTRRRRCNNPPPQNDGLECIGCDKDFRHCNIHQCPEVKKSTAWTPWLRSNSTREGYFEQRFRFTCRANVLDSSSIHLSHVKKERFCLDEGQNCLDGAFINIDGEWSEWTGWSECSVQCGGGIQFRERACDNPSPSGNGLECKGASQQQRECNTHHCSRTEVWEEWAPWSNCEYKQEQFRQRKCKLQQLSDAQICEGATRESRICLGAQPSMSIVEDGIHLEHAIEALFAGLFFGAIFGMLSTYLYMKHYNNRRHHRLNNRTSAKPNEYAMGNEWRNSKSVMDSPSKAKEATIKRNGQMRTPIHVDYNF